MITYPSSCLSVLKCGMVPKMSFLTFSLVVLNALRKASKSYLCGSNGTDKSIPFAFISLNFLYALSGDHTIRPAISTALTCCKDKTCSFSSFVYNRLINFGLLAIIVVSPLCNIVLIVFDMWMLFVDHTQ